MNVTLQELYTILGELTVQQKFVTERTQIVLQQIQLALNQQVPQPPQEVKK